MKWSKWFKRFDSALAWVQLILAILVGIAGAYILGSVFGMGFKGVAIGFFLGVAIVYVNVVIGD